MNVAVESPRAGSRATVATLCSLVAGLALADRLSDTVLPLTTHHFTMDAAVIGLVLAIHPLLGLVAQPLVGVISDQIWTPLGRRAVFIIGAAPAAAACLIFLPRVTGFGAFIALVIAFQFFLALLWGADHPLLADLVPAPRRTFVKSCMMAVTNAAVFLFMKYGLGHAQERWGEPALYYAMAAALVLFVALPAFFLREQPVVRAPRPRLTLRRYVEDFFGDPVLRRFGLLAFLQSAFFNAVIGYVALFAVQTVGITKGAFGRVWSVEHLIAVACIVPLGILVERWPKQWVLIIGYGAALLSCLLGYVADDAGDFVFIALLFGFGMMTVDVTHKPFFSEHLPRDIIGQLTGAWNICYAIGRIVSLVLGGWMAAACHNDFRVVWLMAAGFGIAAAVLASSLEDPRHPVRKVAPVPEGFGPAVAER